jgi:Asp-tRNA(Asn)/Glu-tRNA(Gln) amidotransferase A subunit family amidase
MKVEISETTYEAIAAVEPDVSAFVERAARRALSQAPGAAPRRDVQAAKQRLMAFRDKLAGVSTSEFVDDSRQGRE